MLIARAPRENVASTGPACHTGCMAKQRVKQVLEVVPLGTGKVEVHVRLACGCSVRKRVRGDQVVVGGGRKSLADWDTQVRFGLYACPVGHGDPKKV